MDDKELPSPKVSEKEVTKVMKKVQDKWLSGKHVLL